MSHRGRCVLAPTASEVSLSIVLQNLGKIEMASSTILSSHFTSQTTSVAQTAVSTTTPTLAWVIPEESLAIFASDHIPDFYYDGYSQDEADVVTLFLGAFSVSKFRGISSD